MSEYTHRDDDGDAELRILRALLADLTQRVDRHAGRLDDLETDVHRQPETPRCHTAAVLPGAGPAECALRRRHAGPHRDLTGATWAQDGGDDAA